MAEFAQAKTATLKMKVPITADGNLVQSGDTAAAEKYESLQGVKAGITLSESKTLFSAIYGTIGGTTFDTLSAVKTTTQEVLE